MYLLFRLGILQIQRQPHSYYRSLLFTFRQGLWSVFPPMICSLEGRGMLQNRSFVYTDARCGDWWLWLLLLLMWRCSNRCSWFAAAYVLMDVYLLIKFFVNCVWNYLQIWLCCVCVFKICIYTTCSYFCFERRKKKCMLWNVFLSTILFTNQQASQFDFLLAVLSNISSLYFRWKFMGISLQNSNRKIIKKGFEN